MFIMQVVEEFLQNYLPQDVKLSDQIWQKFFSAVTDLHQSARTHHYLSDFLKICSEIYKKNRRSLEFVTDLLMLDVKNLLLGKLKSHFVE